MGVEVGKGVLRWLRSRWDGVGGGDAGVVWKKPRRKIIRRGNFSGVRRVRTLGRPAPAVLVDLVGDVDVVITVGIVDGVVEGVVVVVRVVVLVVVGVGIRVIMSRFGGDLIMRRKMGVGEGLFLVG